MSPDRLRRDLEWGITWGLRFAVGYTVLGGLILGIGNAGLAAIARVSLSYFGAGLVGGLVAGACRPLNGSRAGRWLMCMLVMAPVAFSFTAYLSGAPTNWGKPEWVALAFMTVVLGPIFGSIFYRES